MLARVKGLPLMYQTYSKRWSPEDNRPQFIVKRLVPNENGDKIDIVMESDQDITDFMARKGRFKGQHGFNKGFSYLAPIYHVERDEMPFYSSRFRHRPSRLRQTSLVSIARGSGTSLQLVSRKWIRRSY